MNLLVRSFHAGAPSEIHAVRGLLDTVKRLIVTLQPSQIVFATEGGHGHRRAMHDGYKASRSETPPELKQQIELAHFALETLGWPLLIVEDYEADDVLATLARQLGQRLTIATTDKDLWQLADRCRVFDPYKSKTIDNAACVERFGVEPHQLGDLLALAGDSSDDVPGVPGIGPKKAAAMLAEFGDLDSVLTQSVMRRVKVSKAWTAVYENREAAQLSRRLVTLVDDLTLSDGWKRCTVQPPSPLWQVTLQNNGLGAVAGRLADAFDSFDRKPEACAFPVSEPVADEPNAVASGFGSNEQPTASLDVLRDAYERGRKHGDETPSAREGSRRGQFGEGKPGNDPSGYSRAFWAGVRGEPFPFATTAPAASSLKPAASPPHTAGSLF